MGPGDLHAERYGALGGQEGDLQLPAGPHPPVVCLLHGGFWRLPYGRDQLDAVARDLAIRGFAVWNLEYRRIGAPATDGRSILADVAAGIGHLAELAARGVDLDLDRVLVVGHSAGGQLALWAAAQGRRDPAPEPRVRIVGVAGLAALTDLAYAHELGPGTGADAIAAFLGGTPREQPDRCAQASPRALLPLGLPQLILHGDADPAVPVALARAYVQAARDAGDRVDYRELSGVGHMAFIDPASGAHAALCAWLAQFQA